MVVDEEVNENQFKPLLWSERTSLLKESFDKADIVRDVRLALSAQTVDATPL